MVFSFKFLPGELRRFVLLGILFALIVGTYWFLRPIKDGVFITLIGADYLPHAQLVSLVSIVPILMLYSKLVDWLPRQQLFYVLAIFFSALLVGFTILLQQVSTSGCPVGSWGGCILGLSFYVFVKIFGSIMVALFWAFVADITTPEAAQRGYGLIAAIGQLGNIGGSLFVNFYAVSFGLSALTLCGVGAILAIVPLIFYLIKTTPAQDLIGYQARGSLEPIDQRPGLLGGLRLILAQPYLLAIFSTIAIYELVQAVFDFRFKVLASQSYQGSALVQYLGQFGAITGVVALICLLFGIGEIAKKFGLQTSLVLFPVCLLGLIVVNVQPSLMLAMWVMVITRALNYALNQPSKEQLYVVTTKQTKYKSKAWIEVFGTRSTEAFAQMVNLAQANIGLYFALFSSLLAFGLVGVWIFIAIYLGRLHRQAVSEDHFVC